MSVMNTYQLSNGMITSITAKGVTIQISVKERDLFQEDVQGVNMMKVQLQELCLTNVSSHCTWHSILHLR
jgi:hypothetical protein